MSFYKLSYSEVEELEVTSYMKLIKAKEIIKAKDWLQMFELNCVPKMQPSDREKVRKRLYKQAYPENFKKANVAKNLNDLVNKLRGGYSG